MRHRSGRCEGPAKSGELHAVKSALLILQRAGEIPPLNAVWEMWAMVSGKVQGANGGGAVKASRFIAIQKR
jgi:hypothetical protein